MAAEKRSQSGNQSIVDQDAAITAYLDGLLRDPEQDEAVPASRSRKTPGLKVIAPETSDASGLESEADMASEDGMTPMADTEASEAEPAVLGDESDEPAAQVVEPVSDESLTVTDEQQEAPAEASEDVPEESAAPEETEADDAAAMTDVVSTGEEAGATPEASDEEAMAAMATEPEGSAEASPWAWLRVGGMTLAIPAEAMVSRHADAALDPVPGAPAQVAGALTVDGRPRLILSLADVTGARPRGEAVEVLLLGPGGLWGVIGEPAEPPEAFDAEAVQWRSESQKAERRSWLAGTHPAAGVAVLDVAGLRAALKGSR